MTTTTFQEVSSDLGAGGWTLHLSLANDGKTKITGTGYVQLIGGLPPSKTGPRFSFNVKGTYAAKTGISTLALSPAPGDALSKGASLTVTMSGQTLTGVSGKVAGQTVKLQL